jgi:hypothetical protein
VAGSSGAFTLDDTAQGVIDLCLQRTPKPRLGEPREVAEVVAFLLGDGAGYMSGQIIGVDAGYSAWPIPTARRSCSPLRGLRRVRRAQTAVIRLSVPPSRRGVGARPA